MYNKGCDCWRLLSYLCLTTVPPPYKPSTRACQDPPPLVLRLFHTPLGYLNTNSKAVFLCRPNLILQSTGRPLVRSHYPEYNTKDTDTCVPTYFKNQNPLKSWSFKNSYVNNRWSRRLYTYTCSPGLWLITPPNADRNWLSANPRPTLWVTHYYSHSSP